jgi:hypothetical protein
MTGFVRAAVLSLAVGVLMVLAVAMPTRTDANHAWRHADGIGYDGVGPEFGWVNVHVISGKTTSYSEALSAIDNWCDYREGDIWWLRWSNVMRKHRPK